MVDKIRLLCKEKGTTINKLEKKCGLGAGTIRRWDTNKPSYDKIKKVADEFGVSVGELTEIEIDITPYVNAITVASGEIQEKNPAPQEESGHVPTIEEVEKAMELWNKEELQRIIAMAAKKLSE